MADVTPKTAAPEPAKRHGSRVLAFLIQLLWLPRDLACFLGYLLGFVVWMVVPGYAYTTGMVPCRHGDPIDVSGGRVVPCMMGGRFRNHFLFRILCRRLCMVRAADGELLALCADAGAYRPSAWAFLTVAAVVGLIVAVPVWAVVHFAKAAPAGADVSLAAMKPAPVRTRTTTPGAPVAKPDITAEAKSAKFAANARALMAKEDFASARIEFKNALRFAPLNAGLQVELGECALKCGSRDEALQAFTAAIRLDPRNADAERHLAGMAADKGDWAAASEHARILCALLPDDAAARITLARYLDAAGKPDDALIAAEAALKLAPKSSEAWVASGKLLLRRGDAGAEARFRKALEFTPDFADAQAGLARTLLARKEYAPAVRVLEDALKKAPRNGELLAVSGEAYLATGDLERAATVYRQSLPVWPKDRGLQESLLRGMSDLGQRNIGAGKIDTAIAFFREVTDKQPELFPLRLRCAQLLSQTGRPDEAYKIAAQLGNERRDPLGAELLLANLFVDRGFPAVAEEYCARLVVAGAKDPRIHQVHKVRAKIAAVAGDGKVAVKELEEFLKAEPDDLEAELALASWYYQLGKTQEAMRSLKATGDRHPTVSVPQIFLAQWHILDNNLDAAIECYREALARTPENPVAINNLAVLLSEQPKTLDEAQTLAEKARRVFPADPNSLDTLGWVLFQRGDVRKAFPLLLRASAQQAANPTIRYHLAQVLAARGQTEEAVTHVEVALESTQLFRERPAAEALLAELSKRVGASPATGQPAKAHP